MRTVLLLALTSPACILLPNPDPSEVHVECQLQPQEPTEESPNPPDPCDAWLQPIVARDLSIHQRLWRETFSDTDEWAAEAPMLPSKITVLNSWDVCTEVSCTDTQRETGLWGITTPTGIWVSGYRDVWDNPEELATPKHSALAHELVHQALVGAYGDGDRNHEEPGGEWGPEHEEYIRALRDAWEK